MSGAHAFLAPSSMGITVHCSYYPHVAANYPDMGNLAAEEGTAAHYVLEQMLLYWKCWLCHDDHNRFVGLKADNGIFITQEMCDAAKVAYDHCTELVKTQGAFNTVMIEGKVGMPQLHESNCWGTLDFGFYEPSTQTIVIRDFKYGFGLVEVYKNWQLITYLCGMLIHYPYAQFVDLGVSQPRPYHRDGKNRSWSTNIQNIVPLIEQLRLKIIEVFTNPTTTPGDHCRYCPGNLSCQAFINSGLNAIDYSILPDMRDLSDEELGKLYEIADRAFNAVKQLRDNAADRIIAKINQGQLVKGWMIEQKPGHSYWGKSEKTIIEVCQMLGIDSPTQVKLKTPIQILDTLGKDDPRRQALTPYLKRNLSSTRLLPNDGREAERVFGPQN